MVGLAASVLAGLPPLAAAQARPRNPSDGEIAAAQQARARKASDVGRLTGLVALADGDMTRATDQAELAVERYHKAQIDLATAVGRARQARAGADAAQRALGHARRAFSAFARDSYIQGSTVDSVTALLGATSPRDLLDRADLLSYASRGPLDAVGRLDLAKVRQANAESSARAALVAQQQATAQAAAAKAAAIQAVRQAREALAALRQQRAALITELEAARVSLDGLVAERARYQAWVRAQAEAAARAAAARAAALRAAEARAAAARAAAARAAAQQAPATGSQGGPAGTGGVQGWTGGGGWTPAEGQHVADAALRWLGTPYAWGGGDSSGPTWGIDGPDAGWNDANVFGFDCSGLGLWAWAQVGVQLGHYTGYQYTSGQHIPLDQLMPGDLVFWAYDTSDPSTIHHVAIYLGGGQVIQAPQSGDVVKISPMWFDGYIGATRPGT